MQGDSSTRYYGLIHRIPAESQFAENIRKVYEKVGIIEAEDETHAEKLVSIGIECYIDETKISKKITASEKVQ